MAATDLSRSLDETDRALARAEGIREALAARRVALVREVGLAKGRIAKKPKVDAFLQEFQEESSRRNVGKYERLLDALVDEVFPDLRVERRRIVLELTTDRGLPSLDILMEADGVRDEREDVLEDNGGALTNVVSAGLRMIAVMKSGSARFLVLDEPDCWIEEGRVPSFYKVLRNLAAELGVQCLAISHHHVLSTQEDIYTARLQGFPKKGGLKVVGEGTPPAWTDDQPGFRYLRLVDVQGYVDVTIPLSPGVMALTGPNGRGKSTITRAWRAVFYGEAKAGFIRHGAKVATVEVGLAGGRFLRYSRARKRNPMNLWSIHEPDGSVVSHDGVKYEGGGGTSVPDWVTETFRLGKVDGLDVNISHQKFPIFLLGETPSKRASVLSIGQESSYVQAMISVHRENCARDASLVRDGEREIGNVDASLESLAGLQPLSEEVSRLREFASEIAASERRVADMEARLESLGRAAARLEFAMAGRSAYAALPSDAALGSLERTVRYDERHERRFGALATAWEGLVVRREKAEAYGRLPAGAPAPAPTEPLLRAGTEVHRLGEAFAASMGLREALSRLPGFPTLAPSDAGEAVASSMASLSAAADRAGKVSDALARLPALPRLTPTDASEAVASTVDRARERETSARGRGAETDALVARAKADVDAVLEGFGGRCPTCGNVVEDPSTFLEHHQ